MDKLLIIKGKFLEYKHKVTENSSLVKNPIPILWNYDGIYGWIPVEIVKNELKHIEDVWATMPAGTNFPDKIKFTWQQAHRLRPDVGKILEELANE